MNDRLRSALVASTLLAGLASSQASFVETFDDVGPTPGGASGPSALTAAGWTFRNQSEPVGSTGWFDGTLLTPFEGDGYLAASGSSTDFFGGDISLWAVLPVVPGQQAGDTLTVHVQRLFSHSPDRLELRYAPGGGDDTGSGAHDVGDFTSVLFEGLLSEGGWQQLSAPVPGNGRLAIRFAAEDACNFGCSSSTIGLDLLSVGEPPVGGCNLPPLPGPGQTVTWTAAGGPYEICADVSIPLGSTVIVEPGTSVAIEFGRRLTVSGELLAEGTAGAPITLSGSGNFFQPAVRVDGSASLAHVDATAYVQAGHGGSLTVRDSSVADTGLGSAAALLGPATGTYLDVERCAFTDADLMATDATLALVDTTFVGGGVSLLRGYLYVRDVSIDGSSLAMTRERFGQTVLLDDLAVRGSPGPGLVLQGWNHLVGPDTELVGNASPVSLKGGLLTGSVIPTTGNAANHVDVGNGGIVGSSTWGRLAVPYRLFGGAQVGGSDLTIDAGAEIVMSAGASLIYYASAGIQARGTPDAPIVFRPATPGVPWDRIKFQSNTGRTHFEHCVFEGAEVALQSDNAFLYVDGSTFTGNQNGLWTNTGGLITARKTRFVDNAVGVHEESGFLDLDGATNPNVFVGNDLAIEFGDADATHNWWGDPSGPSHPSNPGGQGDAATAGVDVLPFLSSAPDASDAPPRVTMITRGSLANAGTRVLLRWDVADEGPIAAQRVLYSPHGNVQYGKLVDLPADARSYEWEVPLAELGSQNEPAHIRIVAVDASGQEGFDEAPFRIPYHEDLPPATFAFTTDVSGGFTFGDEVDVCWTQTGMSGTWSLSVVSDGDGAGVGFGGGTTLTECRQVAMPYLSTDRARFSITFNLGASGRTRTFFSAPFTIRPDDRLPDAPPTIALDVPTDGARFAGGDVVPLRWTAGDDEGLREVRVQASYDAGRTWHGVATLDGAATAFDWPLPASAGIADVAVRVTVVDARFQLTADEADIAISPGLGSVCQQDLGFAGPGALAMTLCGDALATGGVSELSVTGGGAQAPLWLFVSTGLTPTPFHGGVLATVPVVSTLSLATGPDGSLAVPVPGGAGPATVFVQAAAADANVTGGVALSNVLAVEFLP